MEVCIMQNILFDEGFNDSNSYAESLLHDISAVTIDYNGNHHLLIVVTVNLFS